MYQASLIFQEELTPSVGVKIPFGIHTKCKVTKVEKGENFVDIHFEDSEGRYHNKRLWQPKGNYPIDGETTEQALQREERRNLTHIVKLLHIFLGEEVIRSLPSMNYEQFIDKSILLLTPQLSSKLVNLKLTYDKDGMYSQFGSYPDYIELYVDGQEPTLKYSKWELEHACTPKSNVPVKNVVDDL